MINLPELLDCHMVMLDDVAGIQLWRQSFVAKYDGCDGEFARWVCRDRISASSIGAGIIRQIINECLFGMLEPDAPDAEGFLGYKVARPGVELWLDWAQINVPIADIEAAQGRWVQAAAPKEPVP